MKLKSDKGITLVEILIAAAIATIIIGTAGVFVTRSIQYYRIAKASLSMQYETQVIMEQVGEWVQEADRVEVLTGASGTDVLILWDLPTTTTADEADDLYVPTATKRAIWVSKSGMLYTQSWEVGEDVIDGSTDSTALEAIDENLIGEYVTQFEVSVTDTVVSIALTMSSDDIDYSTKDSFALRNVVQ